MKKNLILTLLFVASLVLGACSKQDFEQTTPQTEQTQQKQPPVERIKFSTKTLEFTSKEEFYDTLMTLITMQASERVQWFANKPGFVSQAQAANMISQQFNQSQSMEEAVALRDSYEEFIFNEDSTELDFTPYLKADQLGASLVANAQGDVKIAGKIVNLNSAKSFNDTWIGKLKQQAITKGVESTKNRLHSWTGDRKMWAEAFDVMAHNMAGHPSRRTIVIRANAQQKICFIFCAWHTYLTEFVFSPISSPYAESYSGFSPSTGALGRLFGKNPSPVMIDAGDSTPIALGDVTSGTISANIRVHTRGVGEANQATLWINNPPKVNFYANGGRFTW